MRYVKSSLEHPLLACIRQVDGNLTLDHLHHNAVVHRGINPPPCVQTFIYERLRISFYQTYIYILSSFQTGFNFSNWRYARGILSGIRLLNHVCSQHIPAFEKSLVLADTRTGIIRFVHAAGFFNIAQ